MSNASVLNTLDPSEFARSLFEQSNDALLLFDPSTLKLFDLNPAAIHLTGHSRDDLLQRTVDDLFTADDRKLMDELHEACRDGKPFQARESYQLLIDSRHSLDVSLTLSHLQLQNGAVGVISIRDVSDRRQLEANLRSTQSLLMATVNNQATNLEAATAEIRTNQKRMRELLNDVGAIVWEADLPDLRFTYVSNRAKTVLGYPVQQWLEEASFWVNHLHPDDIQTVTQHYENAKQRGVDQEFDYRALSADNRIVWIRNTMHVVKDRDQNPIKLRGVLTDVTARVEAKQKQQSLERELAHVSRLSTLGAMVAGIAHEVNQPLAAISNFASAAQNELESTGVPEDSPLVEWMEQIRDQAVRCGDIIRGMREFTRKEGSRQAPVEIERVIQDAIVILQSGLQRQTLKIDVRMPAEPVSIRGNATELQQVLVNLLANACESLAEADVDQPAISVEGHIDGGRLVVSVTDNGIGIAREILPRLFDPFFTTRPDGLGIGLAISRNIIEHHEGKLSVDTQHTPGARFRFELPLISPF
ncbi:MAG: ATP-binding protein [Planctomycetota bacterium]